MNVFYDPLFFESEHGPYEKLSYLLGTPSPIEDICFIVITLLIVFGFLFLFLYCSIEKTNKMNPK